MNTNTEDDENNDKKKVSTILTPTTTTATAVSAPPPPPAIATTSKNVGILRVDTAAGARRITQPSEPSSPQPSVDRLSVSFALGGPATTSDYYDTKSASVSDTEQERQQQAGSSSSKQQQGQPQEVVGIPSNRLDYSKGSKLNLFNMAENDDPNANAGGGGSGRGSATGGPPLVQHLSTTGLTDEDEDYSASVSAILHRRASVRKVKGVGRRTSSPLDSDRRRSSVFTTSSGETAITMDGLDGPITQEQIFENIRLHKEVLENVKNQPWEMRRKLKLVQQAKEYVRLHEGQLQERLAKSKSTRDFVARFNILLLRWWQHIKREAGNLTVILTPWELRIKEIESHFGSVVASYFTFLRWMFWINIVITTIIIVLIIVPEVLAADPALAGERKILLESEKETGSHLETIWNFEGVMKHSPLFYGYYSDQPKTKEGYPLPLSYFLTGLGVYAYSFVAILRRMAKNSKQSKLSEKEDECIFSWKLFTGWDYMIGNPETAFNRFASITMGFKEALLEEKEKKKDERNWKIIGLRVLANFLVLLLLISSALAVILVVNRSDELERSGEAQNASWWRKNEITLVLSLITTVFPNIFELIGMLEKYHPRKQLRWQLARIMVLNFLNLYTLIIALFGQVHTMTTELEKLLPSSTIPPTTMPPDFNYCVNVSVNCTVLEDFEFYQKEKHAKDVLTLLVKSVLYSKYEPEQLIPYTNENKSTISSYSTSFSSSAADILPFLLKQTVNETKVDYATLLAKEVVQLLYSATPQMGNISEDLRQYLSEVNDHENLTLTSPFLNGIDAANMIPENATVLKTTLPILFGIIYKYIPTDRLFKHLEMQKQQYFSSTTTESYDNYTSSSSTTTDLLSCNITSMCLDDEDLNSSISSTYSTTGLESSTSSSALISSTSTMSNAINGAGAGIPGRSRRTTTTRRSPPGPGHPFRLPPVSSPRTLVPATTTTTRRRVIRLTTPSTTTRLTYRRRRRTTTTKPPQTTQSRDFLRRIIRSYTIFNSEGKQSSPKYTIDLTAEENSDSDDRDLQLAGENSYQSVAIKSSTRGDIPGDLSVSEDDFTTSTSSTTPIPSSSSTFEPIEIPEDFTEKLITTIVTMIQIISTQNSSRIDYSNLTTVDQFVELVAKFHTKSETILTNDPYNSSLSATFDRKTLTNETNKCFIKACENGTTFPPNILEYLNCTDLQCAMDRLLILEPAHANLTMTSTPPPPGCIIPGSRSCITTEPTTTRYPEISIKLRRLCWETMFGQELVKLTVMDLIFTVGFILVLDFIRAILVRILNPCWCWDLEKKFPQYGDFKIAENILHLVNNQGMVWMGMFFSPGLPALNLVKLVILMYIRSWAVMTCNVPHETVFRASRSNNFYFALLLFMLFLCTLPVGYAIVWLKPSWHCGPFSKKYDKIYHILTKTVESLVPETFQKALDYLASPAIIIPLLVLLVLIIYYLTSLTNSLRESNNDLKVQLRRERTEERRKMFRIAGGKGKEKESPFTRWKSLIPVLGPETAKVERPSILTTGKQTGFAGLAKRAALKAREQQAQQGERTSQDDGNATDMDQASLPEDIVALPQSAAAKAKLQKKTPVTRKPSCTDSVTSIRSEIPVITISKEEDNSAKSPSIAKSPIPEPKPSGSTTITQKKPPPPPPSRKEKLPPPPPSPPSESAPSTIVKRAEKGSAGSPMESAPSKTAKSTAEQVSASAGPSQPKSKPEVAPKPAVPVAKKQKLLQALLKKSKEIRSPPAAAVVKLRNNEPTIESSSAVTMTMQEEEGTSGSRNKTSFFITTESLEEKQLLTTDQNKECSENEDDISYLKMDNEQTDVRPFFSNIEIQKKSS